MKIEDFAGKGPEFLPEHYLAGRLEGWGVIETVLGDLHKRFIVEANGDFDTATQRVTFQETWRFEDGFSDTLTWQIDKRDNGRYTGREARVKDDAIGEQAGFAFHWQYTRDTPQRDGSSTTLNFNDWFYLIDPSICIVRGSAGRLGLPFAIAHVTYRKLA